MSTDLEKLTKERDRLWVELENAKLAVKSEQKRIREEAAKEAERKFQAEQQEELDAYDYGFLTGRGYVGLDSNGLMVIHHDDSFAEYPVTEEQKKIIKEWADSL